MKTLISITFQDLINNLDAWYIQDLTEMKFSIDYADFNFEFEYELYKRLDYLNKTKNLGLHLGLLGDNIDYTDIYYKLN